MMPSIGQGVEAMMSRCRGGHGSGHVVTRRREHGRKREERLGASWLGAFKASVHDWVARSGAHYEAVARSKSIEQAQAR